MQHTLKKWSLEKHYKSIHVLGENSSREESLTPKTIVDRMVETILQNIDINVIKNPNFKVLDPACGTGSFLIAWYEVLINYHSHGHVINNMLYGFETNFSYFKANRKYYQFNNIYKESFLETNKLNNMKFDVIVGNPPYSAGMHMSFVNLCFDLLKEDGILSIIHPSQPFLNNKPTQKQNREIRLNQIVNNNTTFIELLNGNLIFDNIKIFVPLSITTIIKDYKPSNITIYHNHFERSKGTVSIIKDISDLTIHGNIEIVKSIKNKILKKSNEMVVNKLTYIKRDNKHYVNFNILGGNVSASNLINNDFYCPFYKTDENDVEKIITNTPSIYGTSLEFNTHEDAFNFFRYMKTKFSRFCISLCKINQHFDRGETSYLPYLDPRQEWDDNKCFDYFELSKTESAFIKEYIGNWYDIDFK